MLLPQFVRLKSAFVSHLSRMSSTLRQPGAASSQDENFMRMAIRQARLGESIPGAGEVGCVIVKDAQVVAMGHNEARLRNDPTAHPKS